jgi:hypothetical protein
LPAPFPPSPPPPPPLPPYQIVSLYTGLDEEIDPLEVLVPWWLGERGEWWWC